MADSQSSDIDKDALYGKFEKGKAWRDKLHKTAVHKALDIAEPEDMQISANRTYRGIGALGAVGIAAATMLPWGAFVAYLLTRPPAGPAPQPPAPASAPKVQPVDLQLKWWLDQDGKLQMEPKTEP